MLSIVLVAAGLFTVGLGIAHFAVPVCIPFRSALEPSGQAAVELGGFGRGGWTYRWSRRDLMGITWVMSNAASYVIVSIGLLDLAIATGSRPVPTALAGGWIAGWWALRAAGQLIVGRRPIDLAIGGGFLALASVHVWLALIPA